MTWLIKHAENPARPGADPLDGIVHSLDPVRHKRRWTGDMHTGVLLCLDGHTGDLIDWCPRKPHAAAAMLAPILQDVWQRAWGGLSQAAFMGQLQVWKGQLTGRNDLAASSFLHPVPGADVLHIVLTHPHRTLPDGRVRTVAPDWLCALAGDLVEAEAERLLKRCAPMVQAVAA